MPVLVDMGIGTGGSHGYGNPHGLALQVCVNVIPLLSLFLPVSTLGAVAHGGGCVCYCGRGDSTWGGGHGW